MIGMEARSGSPFSARHSSKPSISGISVSETMRSGRATLTFSSASRPVTAVVTRKPAFLSDTSSTRRLRASPSTRRRLHLDIALGPVTMARFSSRGAARPRAGEWAPPRVESRNSTMAHRLVLDYGQRPRAVQVPDGARVLRAPTPEAAPPPLGDLLTSALDRPVAAAPLEEQAAGARRVLVVISDATRGEPRDALVRAVLARMSDRAAVDVAIATGTHGPADPGALGVGDDLWRRVRSVVNHDGARTADLVALGTTRRGTPVEIHRAVVEADL